MLTSPRGILPDWWNQQRTPGTGFEIAARVAHKFKGVFWTDCHLWQLTHLCALGDLANGVLAAVY